MVTDCSNQCRKTELAMVLKAARSEVASYCMHHPLPEAPGYTTKEE